MELGKQKEARLLAQLEFDKKKWEDEKEQRRVSWEEKNIQNMQLRSTTLHTNMECVAKLSGGQLKPHERDIYKKIILDIVTADPRK